MAIKRSGSQEEALQHAFKFLSYRPRSEAEVRGKLNQLGYPQKVILTTLEKLRSLNLLDDEAFARGWARGRSEGRGYGPLRIERELREKGLDRTLINRVVQETLDQRDERESARRLLARRFKGKELREGKMLHRAVGFLQRRGYRSAVIAEVLRMPVED